MLRDFEESGGCLFDLSDKLQEKGSIASFAFYLFLVAQELKLQSQQHVYLGRISVWIRHRRKDHTILIIVHT